VEAVEDEGLEEVGWDVDRRGMGCRVGIGREANDYQKNAVVDGVGAEVRIR
jgi:hypothetical protein